MPLAAITYDIRPGHEEEIEKIFASFQRVAGPAVPDERDEAAGRILATALFIRDATLVRFIEYEGDLDTIIAHMGRQPGVQEIERKLKPYLSRPRDTATVEGFVHTFKQGQLRCISHLSVRDRG